MNLLDEINFSINLLTEKFKNNPDKLNKIKNMVTNIECQLIKEDINKEKKKILDNYKKKIFKKFFEIYNNKFFYLKNLNVFYIYTNNDFKIISSDLILLKLKEQIPDDLNINKSILYKNLLDEIKKNHIFNTNDENTMKLNLDKKTINQVKNIFKKLLGNMIYVDYILNFLSMSINDEIENDYVNLWYGYSAYSFLNYIKSIITEYIRPCPKSIHTIKLSYNNYDFEKLKIIKFPDKSFESLKEYKDFKYNKPKIAIVLYYYSKLLKPYKLKKIALSDINYFQKYNKKDIYLKKIIEENIEIETNGIIMLKELYIFIKDFIKNQNLPTNIYSYNDIIDFMEKNYSDFIDSKYIYRGITLKEFNKYNIFQEFTSKNIIKCEYGQIRIRELYESFKVWFQEKYDYVSFPQKIDIKKYMDDIFFKYLNENDNSIYDGITLIHLNKYIILKKFLEQCTIVSENSFTKNQVFYDSFKLWYGINYKDNSDNSIYISKIDIETLMKKKYLYEKYKGWKGFKIKNIFILNNQDINEIKLELEELNK